LEVYASTSSWHRCLRPVSEILILVKIMWVIPHPEIGGRLFASSLSSPHGRSSASLLHRTFGEPTGVATLGITSCRSSGLLQASEVLATQFTARKVAYEGSALQGGNLRMRGRRPICAGSSKRIRPELDDLLFVKLLSLAPYGVSTGTLPMAGYHAETPR
jgi:hypothetical protein